MKNYETYDDERADRIWSLLLLAAAILFCGIGFIGMAIILIKDYFTW